MKALVTALLLILYAFAAGQTREGDSLEALLAKETSDSAKTKILIRLIGTYKDIDVSRALSAANRLLRISEKLNDRAYADACWYMGHVLEKNSNTDEALEFTLKAAGLYSKLHRKKDLAQTYNQAGNICIAQYRHEQALQYYRLSINIKEEMNDLRGLSNSIANMGLLYLEIKNEKEALRYFQRAAEISKQIGDMRGYAGCLINLPTAFNKTGRYEEAVEVLHRALQIVDSIDDVPLKGVALGNLAEAYLARKDFRNAEKYISECLRVTQQLEDSVQICSIYITTAAIFNAQKKYRKGVEFGLKATEIAEMLGWNVKMHDAYLQVSESYYGLGEYKPAADYMIKLIDVGEKVYNEENAKNIHEMEARYQTEKKDQALKLNDEKLKNQQLEIKRQNTQKIFFAAGLLLAIGVIILVYRSYRQKKAANTVISEQKTHVEEQRKLLEEKNKEILDSIRYAKRIQQALLPKERYIARVMGKG